MRSLALVTLIALSATGCASPGPRAPRGGPSAGGGLFFSPAGEPFHGSPGEADPMARWFAGADIDHDGRLSIAEFAADHARFFKVLDTNGDGRVDGPEVAHYETVLAPEILGAADRARPPQGAGPGGPPEGGGRGRGGGRRAGGPGGPGGPGGAGPRSAGPRSVGRVGAARYGLLNEPEPVRAADLDMDYRVSEAEWAKAAARRHAILDRDHDGQLTLEELGSPQDKSRTD